MTGKVAGGIQAFAEYKHNRFDLFLEDTDLLRYVEGKDSFNYQFIWGQIC